MWIAVRIVVVAAIAWVLYHVLAHFGYGWAMVPVGIVVALLWALETWRMGKRRKEREASWDRWEAAVLDDASRPSAIQEVREELRKAFRLGSRLRIDQAHLSVILAELLDASGRAEEACEVLARVKLDELDDARRGVVRHAKAVAQISAGRHEEAEATLRAHKPPTEPDLDARFELLGRMLRIERGEAEAALEGLDGVLAKVPGDETGLADDVLVVRAACLEALGREGEAIDEMRKLEPAVLASLVKVGAPRVRALAARASEEPAPSPTSEPRSESTAAEASPPAGNDAPVA